jgi:hypothetical protein
MVRQARCNPELTRFIRLSVCLVFRLSCETERRYSAQSETVFHEFEGIRPKGENRTCKILGKQTLDQVPAFAQPYANL